MPPLCREYPRLSVSRPARRDGRDEPGDDGCEGRLRSWRRERLLDLRFEHGLEVLRRDRADELERDAPVAPDQEGLGDAVDAPVDGGTAVLVGADERERIAVAAEEPARILGLVLVVDAGDANALVLGEVHKQWRLVVARHAP